MSRYEWKQRIATGGMGEVWRAQDTVLGREVAVKVLKPELAGDPRFRERFATEARNAASLHHPNIATVFDFGESGGDPPRPYLVMELVRGRPLSDLLQPGRPVPPDRAVEIVRQAADALAAAHAAGIVHRDVKPGNILLTPEGVVKVTDFGIARAADAVALTGTGEMIGTPHYISPEQAEGRTATPASDVYALGVVLYELLAGRRPFTGDTPVATALAHVQAPVPDLPPDVPRDLAALVRRTLSKDPTQRFTDAAALSAALASPSTVAPPSPTVVPLPPPAMDDAATQIVPTDWAPTGAFATGRYQDPGYQDPGYQDTGYQDTAYDDATSTRSRDLDEREPHDERSSQAWWIVAAVLAVAIIIGAVYLVTRGDGTPADTATDDPSVAASPSASDSPTDPSTVTHEVNEDDYLDLPVGEAKDKLRRLGYDSIEVRTQTNTGDEDAGTVSAVSPTGTVRETSTIRLTVWGEPESESPSPTPSKTPSKTPSATPTPSDTPTASDSPAVSQRTYDAGWRR